MQEVSIVARENRRVAAVGAHPDDVEFMCSGTLKLLQNSGLEIHIGVLANGDCGSMIEPPEAITHIRRQEALNAAELLNARFHPLGERDLRIGYDEPTRMKVTEFIRLVDPLIVFTHPHEDYMNDHEYTSRLVRHACFAAPIPNYHTNAVTPQPRTDGIPYLYYWGPLVGRDIYGEFVEQKMYVNIDDTIDFKKEMLACHKSQRDWLMERHNMDQYTETMRETAVEYGRRCGFGHAEGFRQHLGNAYPQDNILKELLGGKVKEM
jgi:LmbE family N-acetylglucosaminyl deacetylase